MANNVLHAVDHAPLRGLVREQLLESIVTGGLPPGLRLTETHLAARLGTSRVPVREALQDLARDGWIDLLPRQGARVHTPQVVEVNNVFAVRAALESESARIAARVATRGDVDELRQVLVVGLAHARAGDQVRVGEANSDFHRRIVEIARNDLLTDLLGTLEARVRWYFSQVAAVRGVTSWTEHERIVDAISVGDEELAAEEARRHTEHTLVAYQAFLMEERDKDE